MIFDKGYRVLKDTGTILVNRVSSSGEKITKELVMIIDTINDVIATRVTERILGLSSEFYDKLAKGLTDVTISTAAGLERYSSPNNTNFA